jgi:hypothetical protein
MNKYTSGPLTICDDFINQAVKCWHWLYLSICTGINLSEESITDFNLLEIQSKHPSEIRTQKFSRQRENLVGADWEWWFGASGYWLGLRIQAKKLEPKSLTYPELDTVDKHGNKQIDILIKEAFAYQPKCMPIYVFYNYWGTDIFDPPWQCGSYTKCYEMLGCSISHAERIRQVLYTGTKSLRDISGYMYPWSCLICCNGFSKSEILPIRAYDFISGAFNLLQSEESSRADFVTTRAPNYVYSIAEGLSITEEQWHDIPVNLVSVIYERAPVIASYNIPI